MHLQHGLQSANKLRKRRRRLKCKLHRCPLCVRAQPCPRANRQHTDRLVSPLFLLCDGLLDLSLSSKKKLYHRYRPTLHWSNLWPRLLTASFHIIQFTCLIPGLPDQGQVAMITEPRFILTPGCDRTRHHTTLVGNVNNVNFYVKDCVSAEALL